MYPSPAVDVVTYLLTALRERTIVLHVGEGGQDDALSFSQILVTRGA